MSWSNSKLKFFISLPYFRPRLPLFKLFRILVFLPEKLTVLLNSEQMTELELMREISDPLFHRKVSLQAVADIEIKVCTKGPFKSVMLSNDNKWPHGLFLFSSTGS